MNNDETEKVIAQLKRDPHLRKRFIKALYKDDSKK